MNYNLGKTTWDPDNANKLPSGGPMNLRDRPISTDTTLYLAGDYGEMPNEMLTAKFEETDAGDDETLYDDYARGIARDFRPDAPFAQSDEPRPRVNAAYGRLQLQYYGHRGDAEPASHPELFIGFSGADNVDPRGYVTEPDFAKLVAQQQARIGYKRFSADMCDQITGGGRSEDREIQDRQSAFKWSRDRLKVFTVQKDGRREGLGRMWKPAPVAGVVDAARTDPLEGADVGLARGGGVTMAQPARINGTDDLGWNAHWYLPVGKGATGAGGFGTRYSVMDAKVAREIGGRQHNAKGIFGQLAEAALVRWKMAQSGDESARQEQFDNGAPAGRKHAALSRNLCAIAQAMVPDTEFANSDLTQGRRTLSDRVDLLRLQNYVEPSQAAAIAFAEVIYRSIKGGHNIAGVRGEIINDYPTVQFASIGAGRTPRGLHLGGAAPTDYFDGMPSLAGSWTIQYYHSPVPNAQYSGGRGVLADGEWVDADSTKMRHVGRKLPPGGISLGPDVDNSAYMFGVNEGQSRAGGRWGNKGEVRQAQAREEVFSWAE